MRTPGRQVALEGTSAGRSSRLRVFPKAVQGRARDHMAALLGGLDDDRVGEFSPWSWLPCGPSRFFYHTDLDPLPPDGLGWLAERQRRSHDRGREARLSERTLLPRVASVDPDVRHHAPTTSDARASQRIGPQSIARPHACCGKSTHEAPRRGARARTGDSAQPWVFLGPPPWQP